MVSRMANRKQDWLEEAAAEIAAARDLLPGGHHSWVCFTAQQAAEKALKAIVLHLGRRDPTHDLVDLLKTIGSHVQVPPDVVKAASTLNRYYSTTRYPDAFASGAPCQKFLESEATEALQFAEIIHAFAQRTAGA